MPEFIDLVFATTTQKRSFLMTENERLWLVSAKTGFINSGTGEIGRVTVYPVRIIAGGSRVGSAEFRLYPGLESGRIKRADSGRVSSLD